MFWKTPSSKSLACGMLVPKMWGVGIALFGIADIQYQTTYFNWAGEIKSIGPEVPLGVKAL